MLIQTSSDSTTPMHAAIGLKSIGRKNVIAASLSKRSTRSIAATLALILAAASGVADDKMPAPAAAAKPVEIWFVRHAESEVNVAKQPLTAPDDGVSYPLTANGVAQANKLAATLKDVPVTTIYSSTRLRTLQTADAIAFNQGLTLNLAPEIVEIGAGSHSQPGALGSMEQIEAVMKQWAAGDDQVRLGGENLRDIRRRVMPFWQRLVAKHNADQGVIVVVTHGGIMTFVLPVICNNMSVDFTTRHPMPNTGVVKAELKSGALYCKDWNGVKPS
jgi:probable phosphoglycerate mutase